jgi:flagella basal body P-ring formation protein FlgA
VTEAQVHEVISRFIAEKTRDLGLQVTVKKIGYRGSLALEPGPVSFDVVAPPQWQGWGHGSLALIIRSGERIVRNIPVPVEVEALADMAVAVRPLDRGDVIGIQDVVLQKRDLASAPSRICRSVDEVVGKRVTAAIRGNAPIRSDFLERLPLVKRGQLVSIIAENGAVLITATGKAKGQGAQGDVILVQNSLSLKEFQATVVDANTVMVRF